MDTRRDFIKKAAFLSGTAGFLGALPGSIQRAFAIDPPSGSTFLDAEHIVILMQENRSFDHCLGTLQGVRGFNDPRAITLPTGHPVWLQTNDQNETYVPFRLDIKKTNATWMGSLPHSWTNQVDARNEGRHDRWLDAKKSAQKAYARMPLTMGYYTREDVPFYYSLADAFTVCDQHFCSSLTGTMPNRLYFWTGTIRGQKNPDVPAKVLNENVEYTNSASWTTFPERLEENGISWRVYQNEISQPVGLNGEEDAWLASFGDNPLEWFSQYHVGFFPTHRAHLEQLVASLPAEIEKLKTDFHTFPENSPDAVELKKRLERAEASLRSSKEQLIKFSVENFEKLSPREKSIHAKAFCTNTGDPFYRQLETLRYREGNEERELQVPKGDVLHQLRRDVEGGTLPTVSWIVAPENFSDHPGAAWYGSWYVSETLDILTHNPEVWKKTIFILTYDENDGYFDHVPPFVAPNPLNAETGLASKDAESPEEYVTRAQEQKRKATSEIRESPIGLGYRVPLIVASPWSRGGQVCSQVFDHTSVLQFLETFLTSKSGKKIEETNISNWRRAVCGNLKSTFRPYNGEVIPLPAFLAKEAFLEGIHKAQFKRPPTDFKGLSVGDIQSIAKDKRTNGFLPRQEPGTRTACALPYQLYADGNYDGAAKAFQISFAARDEFFGHESAGAPFHVYAPCKYRNPAAVSGAGEWLDFKTWSFAVGAGKQIEYSWPFQLFENEIYNLHVHGPNGFFRQFQGSAKDPACQIQCDYQREGRAATGRIELKLVNSGADPLTLRIRDNAYKKTDVTITIAAKNHKTVVLEASASFGWYDFSVSVENGDVFLRRFAGKVETGTLGKTDPFMGEV